MILDLSGPHRNRLRLIEVSQGWVGTPWAPNSAAPGARGGVSCHLLPRALYVDAGWLPSDFPAPEGNPAAGSHGGPGLIEPWVDSRSEFQRIKAWPRTIDRMIIAGDLLGFRLGRELSVRHLAVALSSRRFIHAMQRLGVTINTLDDITWSRRLAAVWRLA